MLKKEFITTITEYNSSSELSTQDQELIAEAIKTAQNAYAPYSNFKVGASLRLKNGQIFTGNNQENAAYPSGLCAERVAIFYANSVFPNEAVTTMAICAQNKNGLLEEPAPPCGSCRQVLLESEQRFNQAIKIILVGSKAIYSIENVAQLLPLSFKKDSLKK